MSTDIGIDTATIVAAWAEAILYGIFLCLFGVNVYVLCPLSRRTTGCTNVPLAVQSFVLLVLLTAHTSISLRRLLEAFVMSEPVPGAVAYLADTTRWTKPATDIIYMLATLLGDGVLIYRCYIVWSRRLWIIIPSSLLWIGTAVTGFRAVGMEFQLAPSDGIFWGQIRPWFEGTFSCTMAANGLTTLLIAWRIWRTNTEAHKFGTSNLGPVLAVVLESGAVYSITVFVLLMLYAAKSNAQYIILTMTTPIIGLVFGLIITRMGLNRAMRAAESGMLKTGPHRSNLIGSGHGHELTHVSIAKTVEVDSFDDKMRDSRDMKGGVAHMV